MIEPEALKAALDHLRAGGVVSVATETFYGLLADARRPSAVETVFALKGREEARACAVLVPDDAVWSSLVREIPPVARKLASRFWPGPLTIALGAADDVHPLLRYRGKIAVRVPGNSPALELARAFGGPLTATSANPTGAPSPLSDEDVRAYFEGRPGLMVVAGRGTGGLPSTVVAVDGEHFSVLRAGAVPASVIETAATAEAAA